MSARLEKLEVVCDIDQWPDLSYLEQDYTETRSPVTRRLYRKQDRERLAAYNAGDWHMMLVRAEATLLVDSGADPAHNVNWITRHTVRSGGIGGVESDTDRDYLTDLATEQLAELRGILAELGIDWRPDLADEALEG